ncbi:putative BAH domain, Agenet-like domain, Agenet domain, plant type [Helianthus annuus]|nr:putative BAH domain, Agenet-like domain, Agenet domain, plant type [Helianthus annuus]
MAASNQCYVEWKEHYVSKERGKRVVHYFLKDISGESVLAVVGTERSVRHMLYVVAEDFLKVNEAENSVNAGYRWRSRREVVNWLTSMLSKQHRQAPKSDHISRFSASYQNRLARNIKLRAPDIVWSGVAWTCSKQLKHFPAFCRNGITIAVQSFVYVMSEEEIRHLAYLEDMYEDRKGQKKVKVRWFHHSKEVQAAITLKNSHPREVFITPYAQVISVECVDGPALVLAREHYDKCVSTLPEDLLTRVHLCLRQFKNNRVKPFKLSKLCGYFDQPVFLVLDSDFLEDEDNSGGDVKVGAKRPRSARGRQVAPCDSSCMDVKYEILRRKLIPTYVKNRDANVLSFKINEKIELLSLDSGIRGCWFRCTIMQVTRRQLKVQYDDLKDEDGSGNLEEWVPASRSAMPDKLGIRCLGRPTARPARIEEEADFAIEVGSPVDGWWSDGWWEGVVTGIGESGAGVVKVYVPGENLFLDIDIKNIRVSSKETPKPVDPEPVGPEHVDPKPVDPEHVDPEPIGPEHVDPEPNGPGPVDPEPIGPEPVDPEHVNDFNDHELHEKEKDPSSALDDNLQIAEQGEHASENMEA